MERERERETDIHTLSFIMHFRDTLCRLCSCALVGKCFYICKLFLNVLSLNYCVYLLEEEQQESEFWRKNKIKANGEGNN